MAMELNELPPELIAEILRRLSFKETLKSKCVCRLWEALISDPTFLQYRRRLQSQSSSKKQPSNPMRILVCSTYCHTERYNDFTGKKQLYLSKSDGIKTSISLNNDSLRSLKLVLYHEREVMNHMFVTSSSFLELVLLDMQSLETVYLYNPSTEEFFSLPKNPDYSKDCSLSSMGLGRVDSTNEYKVVRVFKRFHMSFDEWLWECEVFTLGSDDHWRTASAPPFAIASEPGAFVAGGVYMFLDRPDCDKVVARFDIEHEEWMVIRPPKGFFISSNSLVDFFIREVDGLFCLIFNRNLSADIWVLKDYKQGVWALEHSIQFSYFVNFFNEDLEYSYLYPLSFDFGGKELIVFINDYTLETKLFSYDAKIQIVEKLPIQNPITHTTATLFTENFNSLF